MKTTHNLLVIILMLITIISCGHSNSQENLPKTKIDVQKEVDENGNIIRYDSTYSYSNFSADSSFIDLNIDSFFQEFNSSYDFDHSPFFKSQDSLFKHFFDPVFFQPNNNRDSTYFEKEFKKLFDQHRYFFDNNIPIPDKKTDKKGTEI